LDAFLVLALNDAQERPLRFRSQRASASVALPLEQKANDKANCPKHSDYLPQDTVTGENRFSLKLLSIVRDAYGPGKLVQSGFARSVQSQLDFPSQFQSRWRDYDQVAHYFARDFLYLTVGLAIRPL
jgi:hypothetical protein